MNLNNERPARRSRPVGLILVGVLIICIVVAILELTHTIHFFDTNATKPTTASESTKGEPAPLTTNSGSSSKSQTSGGVQAQPGDSKSDSGGSATSELLTPTGDFVSSHHVSLTTSIVSVCNTTPGAKCNITFNDGSGTIKSLPVQTTDRGGSSYWNGWTPESIGLTAGSWQISATATLNGITKSAQDALRLTVTK